jgi:hypothetical protein
MIPDRRLHRIDLPQTPDIGETARTLEHLTGRPVDLRELSDLQRRLEVPQTSYAPGGEQGTRNRVIRR